MSSPRGCEGQFFLDPEDINGLRTYLVQRGFIDVSDRLIVDKAGDGNMNCVLRVRFPKRSLILKQARPWVEKYPSIAAPVERAASEARFYHVAAQNSNLARMMPNLLDFDEDASLLIMEEISPASSVADCYTGEVMLDTAKLEELAHYTSALHGLSLSPNECQAFQNEAMRKLNHEHIFDIPLRIDGSLAVLLEKITPGLDSMSETLRRDEEFCDTVHALGVRYLKNEGTALIHGDLFPGSLLLTGEGELRVIDPEFCFCGDPEFDIGVFFAHLLLSSHKDELAAFWLATALKGTSHSEALALQYAGVEIMRRILGVAQLPISLSLDQKRALLVRSREFVLSPRNTK